MSTTAAQQECPEGGRHEPMHDDEGVSCRWCRTPMKLPDTAARLASAKEAFGEAAVEYELTLDSRQAVPEGDEVARQEWFDRVALASSAYAAAQLELHLATRAAAPSWKTLLRDPTQQFDPAGEVMRSIAEYQNATSGTMSAPVRKAATDE